MAGYLYRALETQFQSNADAIAVSDYGRVFPYRQLEQDSRRLALELQARGVTRDSIVGIYIDRSYEMIMAVIAVIRAGGCYLPLDPAYPADRLQYMLGDAGATLVVTTTQMNLAPLAFAGAIISVDQLGKFTPGTLATSASHPDDLAYVIYTSGSTGLPKGVAMIHEPLEHLMRWQLADSQLPAAAATLQFAPLSFDVSFQEIFATLCSGGTLVVIRDDQRLNGGELLAFIEAQQINRLFLPFVALQFLAEAAAQFGRYPACLREVVTAGEALQVNKVIRSFFGHLPSARLQNQYGPSESHVVTAFDLTGDAAGWPALPPIGLPLPHVECLILDATLQPVANGEEGELYLGGATLARGYLHKPVLTQERFLHLGGKRIYKTGDLARRRPDTGDIEFLGRKDGQVKVRGYRIELGEIDVALSNHPRVKQALVDVRYSDQGDKKLVAYLVADSVSVSELREFLEASLPDYMVPSNFVFLESFPRTPSGKIDRRSLPAPSQQRPNLAAVYEAPVTEFQKKLAGAWSSLLEVSPIGIHDNFFDLGGNSLLALRFIDWLKLECNVALSPVEMFQTPTIYHLARFQQANAERREALSSMLEKSIQQGEIHEIAIIGMAARFPGANSVEDFWNNLVAGKESIRRFTAAELATEANPRWLNDSKYVPVKAVIDRPGHFDARFFGIAPREAEVIDPQQRIFLEVAWSTLEDAGYTPSQYKGAIGVYAGTANNSYFQNNILRRQDLVDKIGAFTVMTGNEKDYVATRTAHKLDLTGPAVSVHSACSTSLLAVHLAVKALRVGECDMAIAGGASVSAPQAEGYLYQEGGMLSADGHCRPFDADATGTIFSDGAGAVLLKPLHLALADGDHVYGVIKGSAINNDGGQKASFSAPNPLGQSKVVLMAQKDAGIAAGALGYVETHGTATPLGDPIEVQALNDAFRTNGGSTSCVLGSVKSNFGHLTAAAGIAGLIKATLAVKRGVIPPTLHFKQPNPVIPWEQTPFRVNANAETWKGDQQRIAGVSSFGVGGTNVHMVVAQPPAMPPVGLARPWHLLLLSHQSAEGLARQEDALAQALEQRALSPADAAYTLLTGRALFKEMSIVVTDNSSRAIDALSTKKSPYYRRLTRSSASHQIAFAFPGQGTQMVGMGQAFYEAEAVYQQAIDRSAQRLLPLLQEDMRHLLFPSIFGVPADELKLGQTLFTQLALFMTEYALAQQWQSWGFEPVAMIGHSIGEWTAACCAGVVSLEDALFAVYHRGRLMQQQQPGDMLSIRADEARVRSLMPASIDIAAINSADTCVVAGAAEDIAAFAQTCEQQGIAVKTLLTSHAFHSRMMDPALVDFEQALSSIQFNAPMRPFISSVSGTWITKEQACSPQYWATHIRNTVRFADGVKSLSEKAPLLILELGPRGTLSRLINQHRDKVEPAKALPTLSDTAAPDTDWQQTLVALAQTIAHGCAPDWQRYFGFERRRKISLPTYSFDSVEYWVKPLTAAVAATSTDTVTEAIAAAVATVTAAAVTPTAPVENLSAIPATGHSMSNSTRTAITKAILEIIEEASGLDMAEASESDYFLELGLDSLVLTQMATSLKGRFELDITFRQLMEQFTSVGELTDHLQSNLSPQQLQAFAPETPAPAASPAAMPMAAPIAQTATSTALPAAFNPMQLQPMQMQPMVAVQGGAIEQLIQTQLTIMSQQLALLGGAGVVPMPVVSASQPTAAPVATTVPSAAPKPSAALSDSSEEKPVKKAFGAQAKIDTHRTEGLSAKVESNVKKFVAEYVSRTPQSKAFTQANRAHLADPRVVSGFKPLIKEMVYPIVVKSSGGSRLQDIDGRDYVDLVNGFGTNFLGHAPDFVKAALHQQIDIGLEIGPQTPLAAEVTKLMCDITGLDRAAMCNTGSEAVIGALRLARTVTGRNKIVMFDGAYHGINDEEIVRGSKSGKSFPAAAGIPPESVANVRVLDYGTDESLQWIRENSHTLAAVLVEPVQSRRPDFQPTAFLKEIREITAKTGTALIFDEVITGFRIRPGGAQEFFGVRADLATYGKIIGGGMPIGAIVGTKKFMDALDGGYWQFGDDSIPEVGVTYFAGTFVRHPLTMAAAKAALGYIKEQGSALQESINQKAQHLFDRVNQYYDMLGFPFKLKNFGSLFKIWFDETQPLAGLFFYKMRELGVHVWEGRPCFVTLAHTPEDIEFLERSFKAAADFMLENQFVTTLVTKENGAGAATKNAPEKSVSMPALSAAQQHWLAELETQYQKNLASSDTFVLLLPADVHTASSDPALAAQVERLSAEVGACLQQLKCDVSWKSYNAVFSVDTPATPFNRQILASLAALEGVRIVPGQLSTVAASVSAIEIGKISSALKKSLAALIANGLLEGDMVAAKKILSQKADIPPGARLGKNAKGEPAYFIEDASQPGKYIEVGKP